MLLTLIGLKIILFLFFHEIIHIILKYRLHNKIHNTNQII